MRWLRFALIAGFALCADAQTSSPGSGVSAAGLTLNGVTGSTQCLHVNSVGVVSGTGSDCGSGGGGNLPSAAAPGAVPLSTGAGSAYTAVAQSPPSVLTYGADPSGAADSTAAFSAAKTANPTGPIYIPVGTYTISSTLVFGLNEYLKGAGGGASVINCTMTSAPCIVFAGSTMSNTASGMSDLLLSGPGKGNSSATGVYLGGDPAGVISPSAYFGNFVSFTNVTWYNFGSCVKWGNNAWLNGFSGGGMNSCAIGMNAPSGISNSGENTQVNRFVIYNGGTPIADNGGFDFNINSTSFDYNSGFVSITNGALHILNSHFEQSSGAFLQVPYGSPLVNIQQSTFSLAATSGTDTDFFDLYPQTMQLVVNAVDMYSNHPVSEFVHTGGTISGSIANLSGNGNNNVAAVVQSGSSQPNLIVQGYSSAPSGGLGAIAYVGAGAAVQYLGSPTTTGHTFIPAWQPSGSAVVPAALDLATYLASPPSIGGTAGASGTFTSLTVTGTCTGCGGSGNGFPVTLGSTQIASGSTTPAIAGLALVNPSLGTPSTLVLTNASGLPCSALPALTGAVTTMTGQCATVAAIAHTTFTNPTTPIAANACSPAAVNVNVTGLAITSTISITPSTDVSEATGFGATGGLVFDVWPSATNTASYRICNQTGSSINPAAVTWNITGT